MQGSSYCGVVTPVRQPHSLASQNLQFKPLLKTSFLTCSPNWGRRTSDDMSKRIGASESKNKCSPERFFGLVHLRSCQQLPWSSNMNHHKSAICFADLPDEALIRLRQILALHVVPYSASTLWRRCRSNDFPRPIRVSPGITAWKVGDIRAYLEALSKPTKGGAA